MQQINREQRQASARLLRQLPANIIRETTLPFDQQYVNKNFQSTTNRLDKSVNQQLQTEFDTQRLLSSCPTYLSLSRQSEVDTHECGTQITTVTPTNEFENEEDLVENSFPIDNNQIFLIDDQPFEQIEFMPISSGFGYYPYNYPTTMTERVPRPQIISRAPQFRDNAKNSSRTKPAAPRPTAIKQSSPRSDTFLVSNKQNETNSKFSKVNGTRRAPAPAQPPPPPPQPSDKKRSELLQRKAPSRPVQKLLSPTSDQIDYGRKPVRFAQRSNPPAYQQRPAPHPSDTLNQPRRARIANSDYVIERRRGLPPPPPTEYIYDDDYHSDSPIERSRAQRYVRVVRDAPYQEEDDVYYVESPSARRTTKNIRRPLPPATEYVYVDEAPTRVRSRRPEVVYVDDDPSVEYEDDYIYVDEHGNQVDFVDQRRKTPQYVEYIYEDELDRKRSQKPKVIYVDDDDYDDRRRRPPPPLPDRSRERPKNKLPSSTRIIYD